MKIGILSDAHGNDVATKLCVNSLIDRGAEIFYFLGDAVGYMPNVNSVMRILKKVGAKCLRGNHEEMMLNKYADANEELEQRYRLNDAKKIVSKRYYSVIKAWKISYLLNIDDKKILMVHGSPFDAINGRVYPTSDLNDFKSLPFDIVLMGHTHFPFIFSSGKIKIVNVGSCGMPRDIGNMASCALLDTESNHCEILRVKFDTYKIMSLFENKIHNDVKNTLSRNI